jgi:hypothetical protein
LPFVLPSSYLGQASLTHFGRLCSADLYGRQRGPTFMVGDVGRPLWSAGQ